MSELQLLIMSAAFLGFIHTILGPDHYLPFIVLSKARNWSKSKTMWITFISGIGHVGGSVLLGLVGIAMGISLSKLNFIELQRGNIVGWIIIGFGFIYSIYGVNKYIKNGGHTHLPKFLLPKKIRNLHHIWPIDNKQENNELKSITPWILFLIFVFGPCEVLIPLLIFPAAEFNTIGIIAVSLVFGAATVVTMMLTVYVGYKGVTLIKLKNGETLFHLIAGVVILISGIGIQFFEW